MQMINFFLLLILLCFQVLSITPNDNEEIKFNGDSYEVECKECNEKFYTIIFDPILITSPTSASRVKINIDLFMLAFCILKILFLEYFLFW